MVVFLDEQPKLAAELVVVPDAFTADSLNGWWQTLTVEISDNRDATILEARVRVRADRASSYADYKAVMLQLRALEPENAWIVLVH